MKRSSHSLTVGWIFAVAISAGLVAAGGCTPSNKVIPGAPVLLTFSVVTPAGTPADLSTTDGAVPLPAPPGSLFFALFDRILDPTSLALFDPDGGTVTPKEGVATVEWSGGEIPITTIYFPNGHHKWTLIPAAFGLPYNVGPSVTINPVRGLPSATRVTVTLHAEKIRSHDQKDPFVAGPDVVLPLVFVTEPLQVTFDAPPPETPDAIVDDDAGADAGSDAGVPPGMAPPVATDFVLHAFFNNVMTDAARDVIQVDVTVGGVPVAGFMPVVGRDPESRVAWKVAPPPTGWPAGATVTVTVGATAADYFGGSLGTTAIATFTVKP